MRIREHPRSAGRNELPESQGAGMLTSTLLLTVLGQTADASTKGDTSFEIFAFASMCGSLIGLVLSGAAFRACRDTGA